MRKRQLLVLTVLVSAFAASSMAEEQYSFSFTRTGLSAGNAIQDFAFSFTVPTLVTTGQSPAFTPFTLSDGTNTSAPFSVDLAENNGGASCFSFTTATHSTLDQSGPCSGAWTAPDGGFVQFYFGSATLPTAEGTYTATSTVASFYPGSDVDISNGTGVLTISQPGSAAPEPSSMILMFTMLPALAIVARKRIARGFGSIN